MKNRDQLIELSDEELMVEFKLASHDAFVILYERYAPRAFGFIKSRIKSVEKSEDILQEVFLKLHRFKGKFDASQPFIPWFFTLCRNTLLDASRIEKHQKDLSESILHESEISTPNYSDPIEENGLQILTFLNANEREILTLRYEEDLPFNKVAKITGLSASNVRKIASRAIEKLRGGNRV